MSKDELSISCLNFPNFRTEGKMPLLSISPNCSDASDKFCVIK